MAAEPGWAARWDKAYAQGDTTCSWFQAAMEQAWRPPQRFAAWHDRAVFHFLTADPAAGTTGARWRRPPARAPSPSSAASPPTARRGAPACQWPCAAPADTLPPRPARMVLAPGSYREPLNPFGIIYFFTVI